MPLKTCPGCSKQVGVRTLQCPDCEYVFHKKEKKPGKREINKAFKNMVGIGAWFHDMPKGMPKVDDPGTLDEYEGKLCISEISHFCAYHGLPYCVMSYIDPNRIADETLKDMWQTTQEKLTEIAIYVAEREIEEAAKGRNGQEY